MSMNAYLTMQIAQQSAQQDLCDKLSAMADAYYEVLETYGYEAIADVGEDLSPRIKSLMRQLMNAADASMAKRRLSDIADAKYLELEDWENRGLPSGMPWDYTNPYFILRDAAAAGYRAADGQGENYDSPMGRIVEAAKRAEAFGHMRRRASDA